MKYHEPGQRETTSLSRVRVLPRTTTRTRLTHNPDTGHGNPDTDPDTRRRYVREIEPGHACDGCGNPDARRFVNHVTGGYAWACFGCWGRP